MIDPRDGIISLRPMYHATSHYHYHDKNYCNFIELFLAMVYVSALFSMIQLVCLYHLPL